MTYSNLNLFSLLSVVVISMGIFPKVEAAQVEIKWEEPESYSDVKPSNESRTRFRERTFKQLDEYFSELAAQLPEDQTLSISVTNLDLAGQVWPSQFVGMGSSGGDVRVIKRIDIPRMAFSYTLSDSAGNVVQSEDVKIKDMSFMDSVAGPRNRDGLAYEKAMIKAWFDDTFTNLYATKN